MLTKNRPTLAALTGPAHFGPALEPAEPHWKQVRRTHLGADPSAEPLWTQACQVVAAGRAAHGAAVLAPVLGVSHPVTDYLLSHTR